MRANSPSWAGTRPSVKGMYPVEASSEALYLTPLECTNQLGESTKIRNSNSWKYLTESILNFITDPGGGKQ